MNEATIDLVHEADFELAPSEDEMAQESSQFFAPVSSDVLDGLLGQYESTRKQIDQMAAVFESDAFKGSIHYFITGNPGSERDGAPNAARLFQPQGAIAALDAAYWSKALAQTDVLDCMPQARRDAWNESIRNRTTPNFTEDAVRPTISDLLASRQKFFAERVDGLFQSLSGDHVTNSPTGFGKRMIINYLLNSWGSPDYRRAGLINDLRCIIAKFMGRDEPRYDATPHAMKVMWSNTGQWHSLDGGTLRVRVYKKGTAHLEVHPDMAWRLNQVLSYLHPLAIPAENRTRPPKRSKEYTVIGRPLPFAVIEQLTAGKCSGRTFEFGFRGRSGPIHEEALRVLFAIGGCLNRQGNVDFDYTPHEVIDSIICTGCIPDQKTHQFYPTPPFVSQIACEMADIKPDSNHTFCEPSAGQGALAAKLPQDRTTCVEISALHCDILRARGFNVVKADFIEWAATAPKFDRILMNPPFSDGRALLHLTTAAGLVAPGGRITAILPASMKGKDVLPGWDAEWSRVLSGEFAGTGVSVAIVSATRR